MSDIPSSKKMLLEVKNLRVHFDLPGGPVDVLDGVSWDLHEGETLCVVGESGSGKTVMTHALMGLLPVEPGVIGGQIITHFEGTPTNLLQGIENYVRVSESRGRRRIEKKAGWQRTYRARVKQHLVGKVGLIFQNPRNALDPLWTIGAQLVESVKLARPGISEDDAHKQAMEWLARVHIDRAGEVFRLYPHELSGGMCQRAAIAQILALRTPVVIADEPTTGLDATIQAGILGLLKEVQREYGLSVILITHDFAVVERLADRILVLFRGRQMEWGDADPILEEGPGVHPYTRELLRNVRALEAGDVLAAAGELRIPGGRAESTGCNYFPFCPLAAQNDGFGGRCRKERPPLYPLGVDHQVACFAAAEVRS